MDGRLGAVPAAVPTVGEDAVSDFVYALLIVAAFVVAAYVIGWFLLAVAGDSDEPPADDERNAEVEAQAYTAAQIGPP